MAQTEDPVETAAGITALQRQLAETRAALDKDVQGLAWETDILAQVKRSIRKHQSGWIAGAATAGLVLALLPRKQKPPKSKNKGPAGTGQTSPPHDTSGHVAESVAAVGTAGAVTGVAAFALTLLKLLFPVIRPALTELAADAFARFRNRGTPPPP